MTERMEIENLDQLKEIIGQLSEGWSRRQEQAPLRYLRQGWPLLTGLTDDWWRLIDSLEKIRQSPKCHLTDEEGQILDNLISSLKNMVRLER